MRASSFGASRAFIAAVGLLGVACSSDGPSSGSLDDGADAGGDAAQLEVPCEGVDVALDDFAIVPERIEISAGRTTFCLHNEGETPHDFAIRSPDGSLVGESPHLDSGDARAFVLDVSPGEYVTICGLPGHESLGMVGVIVAY